MKEIFKVIPDYPNYSISNYGNVINNKTNNKISQRLASNGYKRFNVRKGDVKYEKPKTLYTHRIVCELFVPLVDGKNFVNHKDGVKENNVWENLEWVTSSENSKHGYDNIEAFKKAVDNNIKKANEHNKLLIDVWLNDEYIGRFKGKREAAKSLGIDERTIYNGLKGMHNNRKGYKFAIVGGGS